MAGGAPPIPFTTGETACLPKAFTNRENFFKVIGLFARGAKCKLQGKDLLGLGNNLVANLMYIAQKYNVPLWLNSPCRRLIMEGDRVVGVEVEKEGKSLALRSRAVILAAGALNITQSCAGSIRVWDPIGQWAALIIQVM